jgi:hypothetical protein
MHPHIVRLVALTLVLGLCRAETDQGHATVIRDGTGNPATPAIESGGHRLPPSHLPPVPYSLIGAPQTESHWYPAFVAWPWRALRSFSLHGHRGMKRVHATSIGNDAVDLPPLP